MSSSRREAAPTAFLLHQAWIKRRRVHFWGGPDPAGVPEGVQRMKSWMCVLSSNSHSNLAEVSLQGCRLHVLPHHSETTSFVMCLSVSLPIPAHPTAQALERSRISVCFDYRSWPGDVSRAGRSPSTELAVWVGGASPHEHNGRMNQTCCLSTR